MALANGAGGEESVLDGAGADVLVERDRLPGHQIDAAHDVGDPLDVPHPRLTAVVGGGELAHLLHDQAAIGPGGQGGVDSRPRLEPERAARAGKDLLAEPLAHSSLAADRGWLARGEDGGDIVGHGEGWLDEAAHRSDDGVLERGMKRVAVEGDADLATADIEAEMRLQDGRAQCRGLAVHRDVDPLTGQAIEPLDGLPGDLVGHGGVDLLHIDVETVWRSDEVHFTELIDYRVDVGLGPDDPGDQDELATAVGLDLWLGDHDRSEPGVIVERLSCLIRVEGPLLLDLVGRYSANGP